jgi:glucose/arabinose dehydrogenase
MPARPRLVLPLAAALAAVLTACTSPSASGPPAAATSARVVSSAGIATGPPAVAPSSSATSSSATSSEASSSGATPPAAAPSTGSRPSASTPSGPLAPVGEPTVVTSGLTAPWSIVFTAAGTPLVDERDSGRVLEVLPDGSTREVGVVEGVEHGGEGGLLGLAIGPTADGAASGTEQLYAYSTGARGNRIQRFELTGEAGSLGLGPAETILDGLPSGRIHNGGRIAFGPDGMLYAGVGETGDVDLAQDPDSLGGKILRMTPDGGVPPDNPTAGSLVYSSGHRNVQGLAWSADGRLWATEFGQNTWDELNVITPGSNSGWPVVEGAEGSEEGFADPVQQWSTDVASPSGLAVAGDTLFLANLRGEVLRAVPVADPGASTEFFTRRYGRIRDVTVAPDGSLWFLTNNTDGRGDPQDGDDRILRVGLS